MGLLPAKLMLTNVIGLVVSEISGMSGSFFDLLYNHSAQMKFKPLDSISLNTFLFSQPFRVSSRPHQSQGMISSHPDVNSPQVCVQDKSSRQGCVPP